MTTITLHVVHRSDSSWSLSLVFHRHLTLQFDGYGRGRRGGLSEQVAPTTVSFRLWTPTLMFTTSSCIVHYVSIILKTRIAKKQLRHSFVECPPHRPHYLSSARFQAGRLETPCAGGFLGWGSVWFGAGSDAKETRSQNYPPRNNQYPPRALQWPPCGTRGACRCERN